MLNFIARRDSNQSGRDMLTGLNWLCVLSIQFESFNDECVTVKEA